MLDWDLLNYILAANDDISLLGCSTRISLRCRPETLAFDVEQRGFEATVSVVGCARMDP